MKFLIDECLTTELVLAANRQGYEAQHVAHVGKAGWKDWNVAKYADDGEFVLVTNNATDFRRLYAAKMLHPGLIIILPNVDRTGQLKLFEATILALVDAGEPINQAWEVNLVGDDAVLAVYDLPDG